MRAIVGVQAFSLSGNKLKLELQHLLFATFFRGKFFLQFRVFAANLPFMRFIGNVIEKIAAAIPSGSSSPKARSRAFCRRRGSSMRCGSARPSCWASPRKIQDSRGGPGHPARRPPHHQPATSEDTDNFARRFHSLRREKGLRATEAREAMLQPNYYGAMMLAMHQADGCISGASPHHRQRAASAVPDHQGSRRTSRPRRAAW